MDISHSICIAAPRARVFALYEDVASWPTWDAELADVHLPTLAEGATGWLKPRQGPRAKVKVVEVTRDRSFTVESSLPLCRMRFGHDLSDEDGQTRATHWVDFSGPLAPVFRRLIGSGIDRGLPKTLAGLKRAAQSTSVAA